MVLGQNTSLGSLGYISRNLRIPRGVGQLSRNAPVWITFTVHYSYEAHTEFKFPTVSPSFGCYIGIPKAGYLSIMKCTDFGSQCWRTKARSLRWWRPSSWRVSQHHMARDKACVHMSGSSPSFHKASRNHHRSSNLTLLTAHNGWFGGIYTYNPAFRRLKQCEDLGRTAKIVRPAWNTECVGSARTTVKNLTKGIQHKSEGQNIFKS